MCNVKTASHPIGYIVVGSNPILTTNRCIYRLAVKTGVKHKTRVRIPEGCTYHAPIDKRLSHVPFTDKSRVRIPLGVQKNRDLGRR